jgi:hypothetical protein
VRDMAKDAYYFSHDSNAHKDPKILKLRAKHGWEGYGIYWAIIETLREQEDYKWLATDKHLLSFCFGNGDELINQVIDTCLEVGLLVNDGEFIYSESLTRRMKMKDEISEKRRAAGKKGGSSKSQAIAKQNVSNKSKEKESKVNEIKENKTKEVKNKYGDFVSMTSEEYEKLIGQFGEQGTKERIENLNLYKGSKGVKYKDDYLTILNWERKNKPNQQKKSIFVQGEQSKVRQLNIKPLSPKEQKQMEQWEEELPF